MKINELSGYKNNDLYTKAKEIFTGNKDQDVSFREWKNIMDYYGFTHLGSGSYGSAYEHPSYPWVFKIFKGDKSYLKYFNYVKKNQHNPHIPRIKGSYIRLGNDAYIVRLEKLQKISMDQYEKVEYIIDVFSSMLDNDSSSTEITPMQAQLIDSYHGIYEILVAIKYMFGESYTDIHYDNIMMRGNVPVIIDPVVDQ